MAPRCNLSQVTPDKSGRNIRTDSLFARSSLVVSKVQVLAFFAGFGWGHKDYIL